MKKWVLILLVLWTLPCHADPIQIQADAFEMDNVKSQVLTSGNVIVKQKDMVLRSKKARYDQKQQVVYLYDQVTLEKGLFSLTCEEAVADGKAERIQANKNIRFKYKNFNGESQKASFFIKDQRIELSENPIVFQGENTLTGGMIVVDLKKEKVSTIGNAKINIVTDFK